MADGAIAAAKIVPQSDFIFMLCLNLICIQLITGKNHRFAWSETALNRALA